jgi:hypothetical protein
MLSQTDLLNPATYYNLGVGGTIFALIVILFIAGIVKGGIKLIGCGPSEGGIRECFGKELWKCTSGPHLHIEGIFAFRKVSFSTRQVVAADDTPRNTTVYNYKITIKLRLIRNKAAMGAWIYGAEDANRKDTENENAVAQLTSSMEAIVRVILSKKTTEEEIPRAIIKAWAARFAEMGYAGTFGHDIIEVDINRLVERPASEIARSLRGQSSMGAAFTDEDIAKELLETQLH